MPSITRLPQLRPELEPFAMVEDGRTIVVLGDPASGRHFRLRAVEGTILALLDGRRDLETIHREVARAFPGRQLELPAVAAFVQQAGRMGLLQGVPPVEPPRSLLSRILFCKVSLLNPDRLLGELHRYLAFVYHPVSLLLALLLVLAAGLVAITSLEELRRSFVMPTSFGDALLFWVSVSLITLIHELGHGLTCKHFGARVSGLGLLFMYFLPCFFCDVSGAWTLSRRQRLWVGIAGLCFQFVAGAAALLIWRVVEPSGLVGRACLAMASVCGADALLNLIPLLRLDGYYLLSDWLEIPNLRPRALGYVGGRLGQTLLGLRAPAVAATPRQVRIFLVYGTLAGLFATATFVWSSFALYRWLYGRFGGVGAVAVALLILLLLAAPARRLAGLWWSALCQEGWRPRAKPVALAAAVPAVAAALALGKSEMNVVGPCRLEAVRQVPVRVAREGILSELRYRQGDRVPAGAVIGSLETFPLQKELTGLQARAGMLRVEMEIARRQVPLVAAQREGEAAERKADLPRARVALQEVSDVQRYRLGEAADRVAEAQAILTAAEQKAARLRADAARIARGNYPPALQALEERLEKVRIEQALAAKEMSRVTLLLRDGAVPERDLDTARARVSSLQQEEAVATSELVAAEKRLRDEADDAQNEVARARAAYRAAQQSYRQVERQMAPARVSAAREEVQALASAARAAETLRQEAQVKDAEVSLKRLELERVRAQIGLVRKRIDQSRIVAGASGVIATAHLEQKLGRQFKAGEAVCVLDLSGQLQVRVFVDERDVGEVRPGAPVQLKIAAFPERRFEGQVREIVRRSLTANGRNSYEVRLQIPDSQGQLMPGMTGWAKVGCGRRSWGALLGRRCLRYLRTEAWSWF